MANSPESTNNPYNNAPKSYGTLPLEPRVPREAREANTPSNRNTTNFLNQELPRQYNPEENYRQAAIPPKARQTPSVPPPPRQQLSVEQPRQQPPRPPMPAPRNSMHPGRRKQGLPAVAIIGIVAGVLLIAGIVGYLLYLKLSSYTNNAEVDDSVSIEQTLTPEGPMAEDVIPQETSMPTASEDMTATAAESLSLFNRPLTYAGTVSPGGAASLCITLYQNQRIEGTLEYSDGKSMTVYGSYTWFDDGHRMNITLTMGSKSDPAYSESWNGTSSYIKDNLAHTLTFNRINTSTGQSMTASFALK